MTDEICTIPVRAKRNGETEWLFECHDRLPDRVVRRVKDDFSDWVNYHLIGDAFTEVGYIKYDTVSDDVLTWDVYPRYRTASYEP